MKGLNSTPKALCTIPQETMGMRDNCTDIPLGKAPLKSKYQIKAPSQVSSRKRSCGSSKNTNLLTDALSPDNEFPASNGQTEQQQVACSPERNFTTNNIFDFFYNQNRQSPMQQRKLTDPKDSSLLAQRKMTEVQEGDDKETSPHQEAPPKSNVIVLLENMIGKLQVYKDFFGPSRKPKFLFEKKRSHEVQSQEPQKLPKKKRKLRLDSFKQPRLKNKTVNVSPIFPKMPSGKISMQQPLVKQKTIQIGQSSGMFPMQRQFTHLQEFGRWGSPPKDTCQFFQQIEEEDVVPRSTNLGHKSHQLLPRNKSQFNSHARKKKWTSPEGTLEMPNLSKILKRSSKEPLANVDMQGFQDYEQMKGAAHFNKTQEMLSTEMESLNEQNGKGIQNWIKAKNKFIERQPVVQPDKSQLEKSHRVIKNYGQVKCKYIKHQLDLMNSPPRLSPGAHYQSRTPEVQTYRAPTRKQRLLQTGQIYLDLDAQQNQDSGSKKRSKAEYLQRENIRYIIKCCQDLQRKKRKIRKSATKL